jgi:Glycosyl hydrolase family 76
MVGCGGRELGSSLQSTVTSAEDMALISMSDKAMMELAKPSSPYVNVSDLSAQTHHAPFFEDAYAISALTTAYTKTHDAKYLNVSKTWVEKIIAYQRQMTPTGAYFPNYSFTRQPGQTEGDWYVADSSTIAQAVVRVAAIARPQDRARYMASAEAFFNLVESNYTNSDGGVSDGIWGRFTDSWWCSTAIFGAFSIVMYEYTGEQKYLDRGLKAFDYLSTQGVENFAYPSFEQEAPAIVFYVGEFYVRALPHIRGTPRESAEIKQLQFFMNWLASNQKSRNVGSSVDYWQMTYMAGMPYIMYSTQDYFPHNKQSADQELVFVQSLLDSNENLSDVKVWELTVWAFWSESGDEAAETF